MKEAVIICAGAPQPALHKIEPLISRYDIVKFVGADRGALRLVKAGYMLDIAVGDFDSVTAEELAFIQVKSRHFEQYPSEKDDTDTGIALMKAIELAPQADYYLFGSLGQHGGRLDHTLCNLYLAYQARFQPILERLVQIETHTQVQYCKAGTHIIPQVACDYVSIIAMTPVQQLSIQGAKYTLPATDFAQPCSLISNEFIDQPIRIDFETGIVMVMFVNEPK
ncbi:MAG: thiamine diphosphokinase [Aerococcaceae bacterium]|nr:thiamine diphosphokinase [Aerococcaceae bacterium]